MKQKRRTRAGKGRGQTAVTHGHVAATSGSTPGQATAEAVQAPAAIVPRTGLSSRLFREWTTEYAGHLITVERRGLRLRLLINGRVRDARMIYPGRDSAMPVLSAHLDCSRTDVVIVEAYLQGMQLKLTASGRAIGGDAS